MRYTVYLVWEEPVLFNIFRFLIMFSLELNQFLFLLFKYFTRFIKLVLEFGLKDIFRRRSLRGERNHFIYNVLWREIVWFDIRYLIYRHLLLFKFFNYQLYQVYQLNSNRMECGVKVIFWHKYWRQGRNFGGFSRESKLLSGSILCVSGGRHNN